MKKVILKGDANGDGKIDLNDTLLIELKVIDAEIEGYEEFAFDVNEDGRINVFDLTMLDFHILGGNTVNSYMIKEEQ